MGNNKRFYGYVRNLQARPVCVTRLMETYGVLTDRPTDKETARVVGEYFWEVYTRETTYRDLQTEETRHEGQENNAEIDVKFDPDTVYTALKKLKGDKFPGPDDIHPMIFKECARAVSSPLIKY
jgi:phage-related protein